MITVYSNLQVKYHSIGMLSAKMKETLSATFFLYIVT